MLRRLRPARTRVRGRLVCLSSPKATAMLWRRLVTMAPAVVHWSGKRGASARRWHMATGATDRTGEAAGGAGGKRTRLIIDITPALRRRIRLAAAREDVSVREYVEGILERAVPEENSAVAQQARRRMTAADAERLRLAREALARAHPGVE